MKINKRKNLIAFLVLIIINLFQFVTIENGNLALINWYIQLICNSLLTIYIGAQMSIQIMNSEEALEQQQQGQSQAMTLQDALLFPIISSVTLMFLYLAFSVINTGVFEKLIIFYFSYIGIICTIQFMKYWLEDTFIGLAQTQTIDKEITINIIIYKKKLHFKATKLDLLSFVFSIPIISAYVISRHWFLNNLFAILFCVIGISSFTITKFIVAYFLLWGTFLYDIFWVFRTTIMVEVANSINLPIKLVLNGDGEQQSFLGLGDIVLPGVFIALYIRYDINKSLFNQRRILSQKEIEQLPTPYFNICLCGYALGMTMCFICLIGFQLAQPALLYLVPCCQICVILMSIVKKEFKFMWKYDENINGGIDRRLD